MKYTFEKGEKSTVKLTIELNKEEWKAAIDGAYEKTKGKYSVPGFRKGKVPKSVIMRMYGEGVFYDDAFNAIINKSYGEVLDKETELYPVARPDVNFDKFTDDGGVVEIVRAYMPLFLAGMTIFGLQRTCQNTFVALGQAKISLFIALLRKVILLVPLAYIRPHFMGVAGVYTAEAVADATAAILCTAIFAFVFGRILSKNEKRDKPLE